MPRIPTYDQFTVQDSGAATPRVSAPDLPVVAGKSAENFGNGLMQAATGISEVQDRIRQEIEQTRLVDATNQAIAAQLELKYSKGGADSKPGYMHIKGESAVKNADGTPRDLSGEYVSEYQKRLGDIEKGLSGSEQLKARFRQAAGHLSAQLMTGLNEHLIGENAVYTKAVQETAMRQNYTVAMGSYPTWKQADSQFGKDKKVLLQSVESAILTQYGYPTARDLDGKLTTPSVSKDVADAVAQAKMDATTKLHTDVITNMLSMGQSKQAREYLDANMTEINPGKPVSDLNKLVNVSNDQQEAINALDKGMLRHGSNWAEIDKFILTEFHDDPAKLHAARTELDYRRVRGEQEASNVIGKNVGQLKLQVENGMSWSAIRKSAQFQALEAADANGNSKAAGDMAALKNYYDAHQNEIRVRSQSAPVDLAAYAKAANPEFIRKLSSLSAMDAVAEAKRMFPNNETLQRHVVDSWAQSRSHTLTENDKMITAAVKKAETAKDLDIEGANKLVTDRLASIKINPHPGNKDVEEQNRIGTIRQYVLQEVAKEQDRVGHKLTDTELQTKVNSIFSKGIKFITKRPLMWNSEETVPMLSMKISDLPDGAADQIRRALKAERLKKGIHSEPSDSDVLIRYWSINR